MRKKTCSVLKLFKEVIKIEGEGRNKKIILVLVAIAIILAIMVGLGVFKLHVPLEEKDFGGFKMDVPEESNFTLEQSYTKDPDRIVLSYYVDGKYGGEVTSILIGSNLNQSTIAAAGELLDDDGNITVYVNKTAGRTFYIAFKDANTSKVAVYGANEEAVRNMANSYTETDLGSLATKTL